MPAPDSVKTTRALAKYPHIVQKGNFYFLAGQGCRDPETDACVGLVRDTSGNITEYDIVAQTQGVFKNIDRALQLKGLDKSHLCDILVFLKDMNDFSKMNSVWNEYFKESPSPTRTTIAVRDLPHDNFIEMKATAFNADN